MTKTKIRTPSIVGFGLALTGGASVALAQVGPDDRHYHMMSGGGWGHWFLGPLMMLIFLAAAIGLIVLVVRWLGGLEHLVQKPHSSRSSARSILEERFARGEIDDEEFRRRKQALEE